MKKTLISLLFVTILLICAALPVAAQKNEYVLKGEKVAVDAAKMTFPTDGTNYEAVCPVCGVSATWLPLTPEVVGAGFTTAEANTHYYLTDSVEAAGAKFTMYNNSAYTSCLHLNGKNITSTGGVAIEGAAGKLNVMGSGTVKGNGATDDYSSAATVLMGNKGSVNLYGGTYEKYDAAAATNTVGIGWGGGTIAVYSGATVKAGTAGAAVYMDSTMGTANATLNIYGGTIDGNGTTARVVNAEEVADGSEKYLSINLYDGTIKDGGNSNVFVRKNATLNMYGGVISGGSASYGGNVYVQGGGVFNLYDGTVTGGVATSNGGNIYLTNATDVTDVKVAATMNMYGGTVSGIRDADGNAVGGKAVNGGNIAAYTSCVLNITGGVVENGTAEREGGNIFAKPAYTTKLAEYPVVNFENVIIRDGETTVSSNSYGGGNIAFTRVKATIGEGTQILNGVTASRGGNIRLFVGSVVMTGGKLSGGVANRSTGYEEIHIEASEAKYPAQFYMLGGVIEGKEAEADAIRVNAYSQFYLGGDATIVDNDPEKADLYVYKASAGVGKLFICDGWTGSATVDGNSIDWNVDTDISSDRIQVVTLDKDLNATVGGSFTGNLKNFASGAMLTGQGNTNGTLSIGGLAMVDAAGKVTMTTDPLTLWATGEYAFIRLYQAFEITDPAEGLWIDVNGCALTLNGSGKVNVFDSANDTYRAAACGKIVNNGTVIVNQDVEAPNGNRYLAVTDSNTTTMHRIVLDLTAVTLRTTEAGLYYKAMYSCDEILSARVKRYGVVLSLYDMPGVNFLTEWDENRYTMSQTPFKSGVVATSGSVFNIMKTTNEAATNAANGEMKIYANPYICFNLGGELIVVGDNENTGKTADTEGFDGVAMSLHNVMDALDDNYFDYEPAVQDRINAFYQQWQKNGMTQWSFINVGSQIERFDNSNLEFEEGSNEAMCPVCNEVVTWTAFSQPEDTTTKIGVATNGAHYYLTENITYTGSGDVGFITSPTEKNHTACLHLNGHNLTATAGAAIYSPYARKGTLNVMGNGTVSGNRSGTGVTIYLSSQAVEGTINLYGGTYVRPATNTATMAAIINGGSIHVYEGAWLKGNGSGNTAYIDLAKNAAATFAVHGGKITGGEMAVAADAGTKARTIIIDGRAYVEEVTIRNANVAVNISGAPVIDRIAMVPDTKLTIGNLVKGTSIAVSTNKAFTHPFENAAQYLKYFRAWNEPDSVSVTDAGELCYDINYEHYMTPYVRDVRAEAIADGQIHYYFMAAKGMVMSPTNAGDIDKWGDSCLVVFPNGETMLIDAGYAIQAPVIIGSLKRMGVITLDYLVITHPHNDHAGGAFGSGSAFLDEITVEQVYYQDLQYGGSWDGVVESKCSERNIPYTALWMGDVLTIGEGDKAVTMTMLWPGEDADLTIEDAANKNSMVFRFDYGEHSSMFTADIYDYTDKKLLALYTNGELDVDLMKIPHHGLGTNTSSPAFLQEATPEIAVATGSFDIPSTIVSRYDGVGATLLEDRFHGYIHISSGADGVMTTETE